MTGCLKEGIGVVADKDVVRGDVVVVKIRDEYVSIGVGRLCFEFKDGKVVDPHANDFPPEVCETVNLPLDTAQIRAEAATLCQWAWDNDAFVVVDHTNMV